MDEWLALRLGAFRLARRRGRTRDAAWAAARLRLSGVTLEPGEARFAREMRVKFGHQLRIARLRGPRLVSPNVTMPLLGGAGPSRRRRLVAALVAAALLLGAVLLYIRYQEPAGSPEGAQPAQQAVVATPPPPLRGRSQPGVAAPVAVEVTPAPSEAPTASAGPASNGTGAVGGGTGAGGSGGGTGNGNGRGTPAPTPTPSPTPTSSPSPAPTVDPQTVSHVSGRVLDAVTRKPIPNVCVSIGNLTIPTCATHTDASGFWSVDLPVSRSNFTFSFITPGYRTAQRTVRPFPGTINIGNTFLFVG